MRTSGALYFRQRSTALLLFAVAPLAFAVLLLADRPLPAPEAAAGGLLLAAGVALRLASIRHLGRHARVARAHASAGLVRGGPFAHSRNPLYLAAALILAGLALLAGAGWAGLLAIPLTLGVYGPVVFHEEAKLRRLLGADYEDYLRSTPRWLGPGSLAGASVDPGFSWRHVLEREWRLVPGILAAGLGVTAVREGWLPLRELLELSGLPAELVVGGALALGAAGNALKIERKQRRHAARRRLQQVEEVAL